MIFQTMTKFFDQLPELEQMRHLRSHFFADPGSSSPALREAIAARAAQLNGNPRKGEFEAIPEVVRKYIDKVATDAYKVLDKDIDKLKAAGYSEDFIYEITLATTTGVSISNLERGLALVEETSNER